MDAILQLKARAYDLLASVEAANRELTQVNQEIARLYQESAKQQPEEKKAEEPQG